MAFSRLSKPELSDAPDAQDVPEALEQESGGSHDEDAAETQIKSQIAVHDRTQLEAVFDYPLLPAEQFSGKDLRYEVEAYFYFPRQMGITAHSYPKERFYADLRPLVRLREPRLSYKQLAGLCSPGVRSPILIIRNYLDSCKDGAPSETEKVLVDEARIFGCSFASYFLRRVDRRGRRLRRNFSHRKSSGKPADQASEDVFMDAVAQTMEVLSKAYNMLRQWRALRFDSEKVLSEKTAALVQEIRFVDEYCTYRFRDGLARLAKAAREIDEHSNDDVLTVFNRRLAAYARLEHWYSQKVGYSWVDRRSVSENVEAYLYRRGALKRRIWRVLYLNVRVKPLFTFQQQLGAMVAAGIAALWAVVAEVIIRNRASVSGGALFTSFRDSTFVIVMIAFVLAYVLKDRIKELGRSYFKLGILKKIPDNAEAISYQTGDGQIWKIGSIAEFTKFLHPAKVPDQVRQLRRRADPDGLESEDVPVDIIRYRKVVTLHPTIMQRLPYPIRAVHDILRLNVNAFLSKLDDPHQESEILDADGRLIEMKLPKVYHLDVVLKYSKMISTLGQSAAEQAVFDHIRLIVNKEGLFRVERLE